MTDRGSPQRPKRRRLLWCLAGLVGFVGLSAAPVAWVHLSSSPYLRSTQDVPQAPVALVLGAKVNGDVPSPFLTGRLDLAADLYRAGKVRAILVSGDNSTKDYDEPDVMRRYLIDHGVPEKSVVADYAGFDTWDSCARARRIFNVDRATVVTQNFHLARAVTLCRANGIEAHGVGHDSSRISADATTYGRAREYLAAVKAMWEALVAKPDPHFLGEQETGITDALRQ